MPSSEAHSWKTLKEYAGKDWDKVVAVVIDMYPSAAITKLHILGDLDVFVAQCSLTPIESAVELGAYQMKS